MGTRPRPPREKRKADRQPPRPVKGAVQSKTRIGDRSRSWWAHHRSSLVSSIRRLVAAPLQTLMTSLVVAIALALPATMLVALGNLQQLGQNWDANPKLSVYINPRARENAIRALISELNDHRAVARVDYLTADEALASFQRLSGFGEALEGLDENPLPATLVISPKAAFMAPAALESLASEVGEQAIVDEVSFDMEWVRRLQEIMALGRSVVLALAALLGLGVLLAIGNTVRLAIENRRDEILVAKLVGGTNAFVRRPFLYTGSCYGFAGGLLAAVVVAVALVAVAEPVGRLAALYQSEFALHGLGAAGVVALIATGTLLGWLGAWLAVARQLSDIEPR